MLDILMILLIFNPIISVVLDFNFDYYSFTGPVMTVIFFMLLYKNKKHRTKLMVFTGCLAIMSILALIGYYSIGKIFNHILWYVNFCFIMYIFSEEEYIHAFLSKVKNYVNYLLYMVIACNIIELLFMITGWGFKKIWEGRYFQGTNNMPHELAYLMLVLVVITFIIFRLTNKKLNVDERKIYVNKLYSYNLHNLTNGYAKNNRISRINKIKIMLIRTNFNLYVFVNSTLKKYFGK